ncbi:pilus assembly protein CpaB [Rhizobiales bacterium GAS191]|jgi:pilus assembly protein CpaB|nr:pilus assembly protein CpaB [Rhizobiales bacterium GAS113]SEC54224.1 pilus assembly protein CpaB [Rhizobiales bacterium GAS188]SEC73733.1 pilus assembly protein CpaB [Rhizobiales bacterium GAS191]
MKRARIAIIAVALTAGMAAAYLSSSKPQPLPAAQLAAEPVKVPATEVLVAATDLALGAKLGAGNLKWLPWPVDGLAKGMIRKGDNPDAIAENAGSIVRDGFVANEPIRKEKLAKTDTGFLAAILPEGKRALAITIDHSGSNSAGTLVLPNDHVDVIHVYKDWQASKSQEVEIYTSEILLRNIRVLAIGQNTEGKDGQRAAIGETATLELDPDQAKTIALVQRSGWLTLALRSSADGNTQQQQVRPPETATVTIMRGAKREAYAVLLGQDTAAAPRVPATPAGRNIAPIRDFPALARR